MKGIVMVSRALCGALGLEAFLLLSFALFLEGKPAPIAPAVLAASAALVLLNLAGVTAIYAMLRKYAAKFAPPGDLGRGRRWRCTIGELLALLTAFTLIQPFERLWMGKDAVGALVPGRVPVLLVHGYLCNRGLWWWLRRRLRAKRFSVATINLEPPLAGLDALAARLAQRIEALLAETGAQRIALVTHSMGGLVARAYLQQHGDARITALVMLAAPNHGTHIARLGWGKNAREMQPGSQWLLRVNAQPLPHVPIKNLWTVDDEILAPPSTSQLAGASESVLSGLGHIATVFSPRVLAHLEAALARA